jgi:1,4-alpha-glucan branching enzyme
MRRLTGRAGRSAPRRVQRLVRDLNTLYRGEPALHVSDPDPIGFQWIEADDAANSVYAWMRRGGPGDPNVVVICNFTPSSDRDTWSACPPPGPGARR